MQVVFPVVIFSPSPFLHYNHTPFTTFVSPAERCSRENLEAKCSLSLLKDLPPTMQHIHIPPQLIITQSSPLPPTPPPQHSRDQGFLRTDMTVR